MAKGQSRQRVGLGHVLGPLEGVIRTVRGLSVGEESMGEHSMRMGEESMAAPL